MNHKLSNLLFSSGILLIQGAAMAQKMPKDTTDSSKQNQEMSYSEITQSSEGFQVAWFDSSCTTNSGCGKTTA